jgi:predicted secreted Zn-dependent protease
LKLRSLGVFSLGLLLSGNAAALEKCVGSDGKVTYSDQGCAAGAKRSAVAGSASDEGVQWVYYDVPAPGGHQGHTDYYLSYTFSSRTMPGRGCTVDSLKTKLDLKVRMPRWTPASGASSDLQSRWGRYVSALRTHELGHVQNGRDFESAFRRTASASSASDCGALDASLRSSFAALLRQANQRDVDYDAQTRHGATQGAYYQ